MKEIRLIQYKIDEKIAKIQNTVSAGFYAEDYLVFCKTIENLTTEIEEDVQRIVVLASQKPKGKVNG